MNIPDVVIAAMVAVAIVLIVYSLPAVMSTGFVGELRQKKLREIDGYHKNLFLRDTTPEQLHRQFEIFLVIAVLLSLVFSRSFFVVLIVALAIWWLPAVLYKYFRGKRISEFELQLPTGLDQLNGAVKAGMTLSQALAEVSQYAPVPVNEEFGQIADDQRLGIDLSTALKTSRERVDSRTFNLVVTALLVNIEQGGDLPAAMATLSGSLKEIWRLEQKLSTASAEGRKGAAIMCSMPLFIVAILAVGQPDLLKSLVSGLVGYMSLAAAVIFYILGVLWLNKILNFDV